ncbi:hypothetical protein DFO55_103328 [Grimontella sp. AG753]|nr:hypothetical protein DFO55_103328 [Grimontella sp. AG753]
MMVTQQKFSGRQQTNQWQADLLSSLYAGLSDQSIQK